jgi:hypothetical protein
MGAFQRETFGMSLFGIKKIEKFFFRIVLLLIIDYNYSKLK